MQSVLDLDVSHPDAVRDAIAPSLRDSNAVQYRISADDNLRIEIDATGLGPLRGATNTALMLVKLSNNVFTYEE